MLKQFIVVPSVLLIALTTNSLPSHAQRVYGGRSLISLGRAENLAREAAERANGGLQNYRAQNSMYGPAQSSPHVYDGHGTWTFRFKGHRPSSRIFTVRSVVTVSRRGNVNVNYNGPIR